VRVKRYTAATMQEAIEQIRHDLGSEAVILHSRKIGRGGVMGLLGKPMIEVTAAIDQQGRSVREPQAACRGGSGAVESAAHAPRSLPGPVARPPAQTVGRPTRRTRLPIPEPVGPGGAVSEVERQLVAGDVNELLAEALVRSAAEELDTTDNAGLIREYIEKRVARFVRVTGAIKCEPGTPRILAFVGSTGVGKTTTVAKLVAHFSGVEHKKVATITVDVVRVAAVEQMRAYAGLLNIPIDVVLTPTDLREAIARHSDKDVVLIDSAGCSPYDWMQVLERTDFLKDLDEVEVHLVLSASTRCKENLAACERFSPTGVSAVLFTKLDETRDYGSLLTISVKSKWPISYLAAGQSIPNDIEPASSAELARMILRTRGHDATASMEPVELSGVGPESNERI